jgi:hypothetical protein
MKPIKFSDMPREIQARYPDQTGLLFYSRYRGSDLMYYIQEGGTLHRYERLQNCWMETKTVYTR